MRMLSYKEKKYILYLKLAFKFKTNKNKSFEEGFILENDFFLIFSWLELVKSENFKYSLRSLS